MEQEQESDTERGNQPMEEILNHVLSPGDQIIKYGQLTPDILLEMKLTTSLYEYMEVVWLYFSDGENPYRLNWMDIEGMGYGWAWSAHEENQWHQMMAQMIGREANNMEKNMDDYLYFVYESEKGKTFRFISLEPYREDTLVVFLNDEVDEVLGRY